MFLLPAAKVVLYTAGFNRAQWLFARTFALRQPPPQPAALEQRIGTTMRMVTAAAAHGLCHANCLPRSLAQFALLRRQGLDAEVQMGARKKAGTFEAHAWIVVGSVDLDTNLPDGNDHFVPFTEQFRCKTSSQSMHDAVV